MSTGGRAHGPGGKRLCLCVQDLPLPPWICFLLFSSPVCKWAHSQHHPDLRGLVPAAALDVGSLKTSPGESECNPESQVLTNPSMFTSSSCLFIYFFNSSLLCVSCPGSHCSGLPQWPVLSAGRWRSVPRADFQRLPPQGPTVLCSHSGGGRSLSPPGSRLGPRDSAACLVLGTSSQALTPVPLPDPSSSSSFKQAPPHVSRPCHRCPCTADSPRTAHQAA